MREDRVEYGYRVVGLRCQRVDRPILGDLVKTTDGRVYEVVSVKGLLVATLSVNDGTRPDGETFTPYDWEGRLYRVQPDDRHDAERRKLLTVRLYHRTLMEKLKAVFV